MVADLCSDEPLDGGYQPWWVLVLVEGLLADDSTATYRSAAGSDDDQGFDMVKHLLAAIFDAVQVNTVVSARVAGAKNVKAPQPFPRPGASKAKAEARTMTQILSGRRKVAEHAAKQQSRKSRMLQQRREG